MGSDLAEVGERLSAISEELADMALDRLQRAAEGLRADGEPDPALGSEERRITRARRAVDKAAALLNGGEGVAET